MHTGTRDADTVGVLLTDASIDGVAVDDGDTLAVGERVAVTDGDMDRVAHSAPVSKLTPHSSGSANVNRYVQSN